MFFRGRRLRVFRIAGFRSGLVGLAGLQVLCRLPPVGDLVDNILVGVRLGGFLDWFFCRIGGLGVRGGVGGLGGNAAWRLQPG